MAVPFLWNGTIFPRAVAADEAETGGKIGNKKPAFRRTFAELENAAR